MEEPPSCGRSFGAQGHVSTAITQRLPASCVYFSQLVLPPQPWTIKQLTKPQSGDPRSSNDGGRRLVLSCVGRAAAIRTRDSSCQSACLAHSVKTSAHWGAILTVAYGMNEFRSSKCLVCLCFSLLCVRYAHSVLLTCRAQSHDPIMGGRL